MHFFIYFSGRAGCISSYTFQVVHFCDYIWQHLEKGALQNYLAHAHFIITVLSKQALRVLAGSHKILNFLVATARQKYLASLRSLCFLHSLCSLCSLLSVLFVLYVLSVLPVLSEDKLQIETCAKIIEILQKWFSQCFLRPSP